MVCINNQQLLIMLLRKQCVLITILSKDHILNSKIVLVPIKLITYQGHTLNDNN